MDFAATMILAEKVLKPRNYEGYNNKRKVIIIDNVIPIIIGILFGILATWLSWKCNSKMGYNTFLKVLYGFLAYIFGLIYVILYFVFRWDYCTML